MRSVLRSIEVGKSALAGIGLRLRSRWTSQPVIGSSTNPVVCLTTFGHRARTVHIGIESIARGIQKPSRLILWVDEDYLLRDPPKRLRRLQRRGLEIIGTPNFGPHKKYYPYVVSKPQHTIALVTADDDVLYPRRWLATLAQAYAQNPKTVTCFRANTIVFDQNRFAAYKTWPPCVGTTAKLTNVATGVSGVIYPPYFLDILKAAGDGFLADCFEADDIWLHWQATQNGIRIRQILSHQTDFRSIRSAQRSSLAMENVFNGRNDRFVSTLYSSRLIARIQSDVSSSEG